MIYETYKDFVVNCESDIEDQIDEILKLIKPNKSIDRDKLRDLLYEQYDNVFQDGYQIGIDEN
jgi:hypothetical protein